MATGGCLRRWAAGRLGGLGVLLRRAGWLAAAVPAESGLGRRRGRSQQRARTIQTGACRNGRCPSQAVSIHVNGQCQSSVPTKTKYHPPLARGRRGGQAGVRAGCCERRPDPNDAPPPLLLLHQATLSPSTDDDDRERCRRVQCGSGGLISIKGKGFGGKECLLFCVGGWV